MNAWAALECDLREKPLFPVEPRDKGDADEATRQQNFRKSLRWIAPAINSWGVPNASKRGFTAQRKAKKEGLTAGVADEFYAAPNQWLAILEWKDGTGTLDQGQIDWLNTMHRRGFRVACVRTPQFAEALFREWGAPFIDREGL